MNHSFSQVFKHILSKWYIVLLGFIVIFLCSYLIIAKTTVGGAVNQYRAVVMPEQYVDQEKKLKADYDGFMTVMKSDEVINAVIESSDILKEKLTVSYVVKNLKLAKYNTVNIEVLFSHSDPLIAKTFMSNYFGSDDAVGIKILNEVYHKKYPNYEVTSGSTSIKVERGDAQLANASTLYDEIGKSQIVPLAICVVIGMFLLLVLMILPFVLRKVDYVDRFIAEDFDAVILGDINKIEVRDENI